MIGFFFLSFCSTPAVISPSGLLSTDVSSECREGLLPDASVLEPKAVPQYLCIPSLIGLQLQLGHLSVGQFGLKVDGPLEEADDGRLVEQGGQDLLEGEGPLHFGDLGQRIGTVVTAGGV